MFPENTKEFNYRAKAGIDNSKSLREHYKEKIKLKPKAIQDLKNIFNETKLEIHDREKVFDYAKINGYNNLIKYCDHIKDYYKIARRITK